MPLFTFWIYWQMVASIFLHEPPQIVARRHNRHCRQATLRALKIETNGVRHVRPKTCAQMKVRAFVTIPFMPFFVANDKAFVAWCYALIFTLNIFLLRMPRDCSAVITSAEGQNDKKNYGYAFYDFYLFVNFHYCKNRPQWPERVDWTGTVSIHWNNLIKQQPPDVEHVPDPSSISTG